MRRGAEYNLLISLPLLPLRKLGRVPGGRSVARPAVVAWHLPLRLLRRSQFGRPKAANDIAGAAPVLARSLALVRRTPSLSPFYSAICFLERPSVPPWSPVHILGMAVPSD